MHGRDNQYFGSFGIGAELRQATCWRVESPTSRMKISARALSGITFGRRPLAPMTPMFSVLLPSTSSTGYSIVTDAVQSVQKFFNCRFAQLGIGGMRHAAVGDNFVP